MSMDNSLPVEPRTARITISCTEREREVILRYAREHFGGNVSHALTDYPLRMQGIRGELRFEEVVKYLEVIFSSLERKLESGIALKDFRGISDFVSLRDRNEAIYTKYIPIYDALRAIPCIKLESVDAKT